MQSYLFIGGRQDGRTNPLQPGQESVEMPMGITDKETYLRDTLSVGDVYITIYRHESLTSEQVLNRVVEYYKAWAMNKPGARP